MLFLNQIKKDFQPGTWKKGQTCFREGTVTQAKLKNHLVTAEVTDAAEKAGKLKTSILMDRGTIRSSSTSVGRSTSCNSGGCKASNRRMISPA